MNKQADIYDARKALGGYLRRTDLLLARSGLSRRERDEVLGQIAEQFYDLLGVPIGEADREQTENAIARLAPEHTFELCENTSVVQFLRATWYRLMIGQPVPIFLNDHGCKRMVWGELTKRLLWMGLFMAIIYTVANTLVLGVPPWKWGTNWILFLLMYMGVWFGNYLSYLRTPVESMPRAKDWSAIYLHRCRYTWLLISGGSFLFVMALFPAAYWLASAILNRPAWPFDSGLFVIVSQVLAVPLVALTMCDAWRRRRNSRRFQNWDRRVKLKT